MPASSSPASKTKARLIPEKTIELLNAFALRDILGPDTWIWSPPKGIDQATRIADTSEFMKVFLFELKAPRQSSNDYEVLFDIDTKQLQGYVDLYRTERKPDVLYVLPYTPWNDPPTSIMPPEADPRVLNEFAGWTFVIRASHLYRMIRIVTATGTSPLPIQPTIHLEYPSRHVHSPFWHYNYWDETPFWQYRPPLYPPFATALRYVPSTKGAPKLRSASILCTTLSHMLHALGHCTEPRGVAFRSKRCHRYVSRATDPFKDLLWPYREAIASSIRDLDDGLPTEAAWGNDLDLLLTDDSLGDETMARFILGADDDDRDRDIDDQPTDDDFPDVDATSSSFMVVGMR